MMTLGQQARSLEQINITKFTQSKGLYYEFQDNIKKSHIDWNLVAYTDLSAYGSKYGILKEYYDATTSLCTQFSIHFNNTDLPQLCQQYAQSTIPYVHEIENNHNNILASIGETTLLQER